MPLSIEAQRVLRELVTHIEAGGVDAKDPQTFVGYKSIHDALELTKLRETYGDSLKVQGLAELAEWTHEFAHPAITGIIVDQTSYLPGNGYFELFQGGELDFVWWKNEIQRSIEYDWHPFFPDVVDEEDPGSTPIASDIEPPERIETTVYRILRDTSLANHIKRLHNHECQICGLTLDLPGSNRYSEAHHIQPLGSPHNGLDVASNIICVCPNHHAQLDYGAIRLVSDLLTHVDRHELDEAVIEYHNKNIFAGDDA